MGKCRSYANVRVDIIDSRHAYHGDMVKTTQSSYNVVTARDMHTAWPKDEELVENDME